MKVSLTFLLSFLFVINGKGLIGNETFNFKIHHLEIKDSLLVEKILKNTSINRMNGSYSILSSSTDSTKYILLHNGTEVRRFPKTQIRNVNFSQSVKGNNNQEKIFDSSISLLLDKVTHSSSLLKMGEWQKGVNLSYQFFTSNNFKVQGFKMDVNCLFKWRYLYYGVSIKKIDFQTSMSDKFSNVYGSKYNDYGWYLVLGVPFLKYELESFHPIFPEYSWMEEDIAALFYQSKAGKVVLMYDGGLKNSYSSTFSQKLYFKFGYLHYDMIINNSAYKETLYRFYLDELPGVKGTFGLGFVQSDDLIVPEVWFNLNGFDLYFFKWENYLLPLKMSPFKLYFAYLDRSDYKLTLECNLHLDIKEIRDK